jgi:multimeric flavodoxin WrbA
MERFKSQFQGPAFVSEEDTLHCIAEAAWDSYDHSRKSARTREAGEGFADPKQELDAEWLEARKRLRQAQARQSSAQAPDRILLINGSPRTEWTCPGEMSKTMRLAQAAEQEILGLARKARRPLEVDVLDLSRLTSEYGRKIHPCKACVSTAMPLCHWPCSCYPNYALGQTQDWMNEIYERWVSAHGVMIVTPVHWYQAPSVLKLMIDRLVCADGGNPDPTTTHGKDPKAAKALELKGWDYPKHLAGRFFSVIAHGDAGGAGEVRRSLSDWLNDMGLDSASPRSLIDRYVGYFEPYATSHEALDRDADIETEVRIAARALAEAIRLRRQGKLVRRPSGGESPRQK